MDGEAFYNTVGGDRITSRQIDELVGLARGVAADGVINQAEVEFLQKWLAANRAISDQPPLHSPLAGPGLSSSTFHKRRAPRTARSS